MTTFMSFGDACATVPGELREEARAALLHLSVRLFAVDERFGELGDEARLIWLDAQTLDLSTGKAMRSVLARVSSVVSFIDHWSDCTDRSLNDGAYDFILATAPIAEKARRSIHTIIDYVRAKVL